MHGSYMTIVPSPRMTAYLIYTASGANELAPLSLPLILLYTNLFNINGFTTQTVNGIPKQASTLCILSIQCVTSSSVADEREERSIDLQTRAN